MQRTLLVGIRSPEALDQIGASNLDWSSRTPGQVAPAAVVGGSLRTAKGGVMYIVRVMRSAANELRDIARAGTPTHGHHRDRVVAIAVATLAVDLACAVLALLLEHDAKQTQIMSFVSALFWTSTQL